MGADEDDEGPDHEDDDRDQEQRLPEHRVHLRGRNRRGDQHEEDADQQLDHGAVKLDDARDVELVSAGPAAIPITAAAIRTGVVAEQIGADNGGRDGHQGLTAVP